MSALAHLPKRLSVLDDEDGVVDGLQRRLAREGFEVTRIVPSTPSLEDTLQAVIESSDAALCDHYLRGGHQVDFSGAELVSALTKEGFPSVLFTNVMPSERYEIRLNMASIPAFLDRRDGLGNRRVMDALTDSVAEVKEGRRPAHRRGRRTPVTIVSSRVSGNIHLVEVVVSGWPGRESIEIPAELLAERWARAPREAVGHTFFATVNISEPDADQLFFEDFEAESLDTDSFRGATPDRDGEAG